MGYQGNKGNLPRKDEPNKKNTKSKTGETLKKRDNDANSDRRNASDNSKIKSTGTRDTDTDTMGNP
ncbi:MAG: hypothetical protein EOP56_09735 [Sphingobacteriales bacterium]|nr:MAG: hypothetical protein EOP56_09735 [Sphingobacteriales bacterium]